MSKKFFWDQRYADSAYAYGKKPNVFFAEQLVQIPVGRILLPAEGEGRNSVFAAKQGWKVDAFDFSHAGMHKAQAFAKAKGVQIEYEVAGADSYTYSQNTFDVVGLFYAHLPPEARRRLHQNCWQALRPGGIILLEAFSKEQLGNDSGGPKDASFLLSESDIHHEFPAAENLLLSAEEVVLNEGAFHQGSASVIRFIGKKR